MYAAQNCYGIRLDPFGHFEDLNGVIDGRGERSGGDVICHGFMKAMFNFGVCMPLCHGIVDFWIQFRLAGSTGEINQTEGNPATGNFIYTAMIWGRYKKDFFT